VSINEIGGHHPHPPIARKQGRMAGRSRKFRILTVIDQWSRESVSLEVNYRLTGRCVGQALDQADQAARQRGWPKAITVDNGTEFISKAQDEWAYKRGVKLDYTRPGKPTDNGLIESFNGRLRDEFLY
jgi:putative transposase